MISSKEECMSKERKILIFENTFSLADHLFKMWIEIGQRSIEERNRFTAALSGGRSLLRTTTEPWRAARNEKAKPARPLPMTRKSACMVAAELLIPRGRRLGQEEKIVMQK